MNTPDLQRPLVGYWGPMAGGVHTFLSLSRPSPLREQQLQGARGLGEGPGWKGRKVQGRGPRGHVIGGCGPPGYGHILPPEGTALLSCGGNSSDKSHRSSGLLSRAGS